MNSREKGKRGEREFRDVLRDAGYCKARRGQQYSGSPESPDVICPELPMHFEVKRCERGNIWDWLAQAKQDCKPGQIPVVAHKKNGAYWVAMITMFDFLEIVRHSDLPAVTEKPMDFEGVVLDGWKLCKGKADVF